MADISVKHLVCHNLYMVMGNLKPELLFLKPKLSVIKTEVPVDGYVLYKFAVKLLNRRIKSVSYSNM